MRLVACTLELGADAPDALLSTAAEAAERRAVGVVRGDDPGALVLLGTPEDVCDAVEAAARAVAAAGSRPRCVLVALAGTTPEAAGTVAAVLRTELAGADGTAPEVVVAEAPSQPAVDAPLPLLDAIASGKPAPGGGAAAALAGATGAALVSMVAALTMGRAKYAEVDAEMRRTHERSEELRDALRAMIRRDADAFNEYLRALRLPQETEDAAQERYAVLAKAALATVDVPLDTMRAAIEVLELASVVSRRGNENASTDGRVGALLAAAAVRAAWMNVKVNLPAVRDLDTRARMSAEAGALARQAEDVERRALRTGSLDEM